MTVAYLVIMCFPVACHVSAMAILSTVILGQASARTVEHLPVETIVNDVQMVSMETQL